ncbi:ankyrin repeat domain-containing protein [Cytobacillus spongiae]|uniref:ankyrin repeat domain-containing protein n=1 Tax=Cytobacillus spongiae TaxID=2901381 RepID=UPI001F21575F|nr:ankyrin repeat domain-containing protein [Cytobacillus spongiae]UII55057.1 ankyrin repeat domain-containing protein [Cytobacillus spongiae]
MNKKWALTVLLILSGLLAVTFLVMKLDLIELKSEEEKQKEVISAILADDEQQLTILIDKGYPLQFISDEGDTPLETAIKNYSIDMTALLIKHGGKLKEDVEEPLFNQLIYLFDDEQQLIGLEEYKEMVESYVSLLEIANNQYSEEINEMNEDGQGVLHFAADRGVPAVIKSLLEMGAEGQMKDHQGLTPFLFAVKAGHLEAAMLLYNETSADDTDHEGNTPLISAVLNGRENIVEFLVKNDPTRIDSRNHYGDTALIVAANYGYKEIVQFLLKAGADPSIQTKEGKTALDYAANWGHNDIVELLK